MRAVQVHVVTRLPTLLLCSQTTGQQLQLSVVPLEDTHLRSYYKDTAAFSTAAAVTMPKVIKTLESQELKAK